MAVHVSGERFITGGPGPFHSGEMRSDNINDYENDYPPGC